MDRHRSVRDGGGRKLKIRACSGKYCHTGQIYLVNHVTGAIVKTAQPTVIVAENGQVVTAFPGGACRGQV